jgi:uncharacterized membrane protein
MNLTHLTITIIAYLVVDLPWLMYGAKALKLDWNSAVGIIQGYPMKARPAVALLSYVMIAVCIYYFGIKDRVNDTLRQQLLNALMIALAVYGSFDLINYAIFDKLPLKVAITDMIWGIISVSLTIILTTMIIRKLKL